MLVTLIILAIICFGALSISNNVNTAKAGNTYDTIIEEDFSSKYLDTADWYMMGGFNGVSFNSNPTPVYIVKSPTGGSSLKSTVPVSGDNLRIQLDIVEMDYGANATTTPPGWFGFAYNIKTQGEGVIDSIYDRNNTNSDGLFFMFQPGEGLLFATMKGQSTAFYDGNNNLIPQRTQYNYYDANVLINEGETKIVNTTLIFDIDNAGNITVTKKDLGSTDAGQVIIKVKDNTMRQFAPNTHPYVGMCFSESIGAINNAVISEFKISTINNGNEIIFNQFNEQNVSNWTMYKTNQTLASFFGFEATLHFGDDKKGGNFPSGKPLILSKNLTLNDTTDAFDSFVEIEFNVKVNQLDDGAEFGVVTGFEKRSNAAFGNEKTTYTYFTKEGANVYVNVETYHQKNVATSLIEKQSISVNEEGFAEVYLKIDYNGKLTLDVCGDNVYQSVNANEAYVAKLMGFVLNGANTNLSTEIQKLTVANKYYSRPENTNINLTFEDDPTTPNIDESNSYNKNEWNLMYSPYMNMWTNSAYVRDGKLMFENCAYNTGFVTQKQYSNFEMQMDIDDIRRDVITDAVGNKNYPISSLIGYYWGVTSSSHKVGLGVGSQYPFVYIEAPTDIKTWDRAQKDGKDVPVTIRATGNGMNMSWELSDHYDFWANANADKVLQFKIKVEDTNVKLYVKYVGETEWCNQDRNGKALNIEMKKTLTGNVGITTMGCNYYVPVTSEGASCGYFTADNIIVNNLDNKPTLITDQVYATSKIELPTDFNYVDNSNSEDYKPKGNADASGCVSSINAVSEAFVLVLLGCVAMRMIKARRKDHE